ncbi:MAG TPA: SPFH domain-containing protein [Thermomonas sp.]|nr:SPFH domain-containing protein [Thermomonas sp.]
MSSRLPGITRPAMPRLGWLRYLLVAVALVVALLVLSPFSAVPNGHRGIKLTFGKADDAPLSEGLHLRIPIMQTIYKMPVMIERSETESEAASRDLQRVTTQVVLNYHIDPAQVVRVYRQLGVFENIEPRIIDPSVQEAMKAVTATYTAEQLVTKRPDVANAIKSALRERMQRHGLVIDEFSITNFKFSDSFDAAIEAKTVAEQQKLKAERDLERIKVEAEQRIAQARAEAESTKLGAQAQAEALRMQRESITPELIRRREVEARIKAIEKWDGKMPQVSGGAVPFINVQPEAR